MGEITSAIYAAFGTQSGTDFNDALDANPASLGIDETPGADSQPAGLLLGDGGAGVDGSGLSFGFERVSEPKAALSGSFTRPISDLLRVDPSTFTFVFPLCGNRGTASTPAVDADFVPTSGLQAILEMFRLTGSAWGSGVGQVWVPDPTNARLGSAVIGAHGVRYKIKDCRGQSLSIVLDAGGRPIATAQIQGTLHDVAVASAPTLDYGVLASVSPPIVGTPAAGHLFGTNRSLNACTISIAPNIATVGDSEATDGQRKSIDDLSITASCRAWMDDANADFDHEQAAATSAGTLTEFSMQVGAAAGDGETMKAIKPRFPTAELISSDADVLDKKGASSYDLRAAGATAGSEFELIFL